MLLTDGATILEFPNASPRSILLDAGTTSQAITLNPGGGSIPDVFSVTGSGALALEIQSGTASLGSFSDLAGTDNHLAGSLTIDAGAHVTSDGIRTAYLTVNGGLTIRTGDGVLGTSEVGSLTIANSGTTNFTGTLDITNNIFIIQPADTTSKAALISSVEAAVYSGSCGDIVNGSWTGSGLTSSTVAYDAGTSTSHSYKTAVAVVDNGDLSSPFSSFGGVAVDSNSIIITRALEGDSNLDATVNNVDFTTLLNHFGATNANWAQGDFDGNGTVNNADLVVQDNDYNQALPGGYPA